MSKQSTYRQCDFMYDSVPAISVQRAGWYVAVKLPPSLSHKGLPWKVTHGPFLTEKIANDAKAEIHKDFGRPIGVEYNIARLSSRKKEF